LCCYPPFTNFLKVNGSTPTGGIKSERDREKYIELHKSNVQHFNDKMFSKQLLLAIRKVDCIKSVRFIIEEIFGSRPTDLCHASYKSKSGSRPVAPQFRCFLRGDPSISVSVTSLGLLFPVPASRITLSNFHHFSIIFVLSLLLIIIQAYNCLRVNTTAKFSVLDKKINCELTAVLSRICPNYFFLW
jgi:hypothetical protein